METDKDHIHYMIETTPNINLSDFVRVLKQYTTYHIWQKYESYLSKCYWHERTFWSDGYFIASIGEVSSTTLQYYIENQGKNQPSFRRGQLAHSSNELKFIGFLCELNKNYFSTIKEQKEYLCNHIDCIDTLRK